MKTIKYSHTSIRRGLKGPFLHLYCKNVMPLLHHGGKEIRTTEIIQQSTYWRLINEAL